VDVAAARLSELIRIPYLHHERWDGGGYPLGLQGTAIPFHVRIFSVIDIWEAMSVDRPYCHAVPQAAILGYIARPSNTLFDPDVVGAFLGWCKRDGVRFGTKIVGPLESDTEMGFVL
jgi:response regulator RpfG family c-di-GMP phosphodiesterase